jgi:hypothetical protein
MTRFVKSLKLAVLGLATSASAAFAAAPEPVAKAVSACCEAIGVCCGLGCC